MKKILISIVLVLWLILTMIQQVGWIVRGEYSILAFLWLIISVCIPIYIVYYWNYDK